MLRRLAALMLAMAVTAATATSVLAGSTSPSAEDTLTNLILAERMRVCDSAPRADSRLQRAAQWRSEDMLERGYFSHAIPPDGNRAVDYFPEFSITSWSSATELIAYNAYDEAPIEAAERAFKQFMGSTVHRSLIRTCTYTRTGVGAYLAEGRAYFTVLFTRGQMASTDRWERYAARDIVLRLGPAIHYPAKYSVGEGTRLTGERRALAVQEYRGWHMYRMADGRYGWAPGAFTSDSTKSTPTESSSETYRETTASRLNVRKGPGTRYDVIGKVPYGTRFEVIRTARDTDGSGRTWYKGIFPSFTGWVAGWYTRRD